MRQPGPPPTLRRWPGRQPSNSAAAAAAAASKQQPQPSGVPIRSGKEKVSARSASSGCREPAARLSCSSAAVPLLFEGDFAQASQRSMLRLPFSRRGQAVPLQHGSRGSRRPLWSLLLRKLLQRLATPSNSLQAPQPTSLQPGCIIWEGVSNLPHSQEVAR